MSLSCRVKLVTVGNRGWLPRGNQLMPSRRCKSSRGQRLATSPVAELVGRRKRRSEAGGSKSAGSVLSLESCLKVVVLKDKPRVGRLFLSRANADSLNELERSIRAASWRAVAEATGVVDQVTPIKGWHGNSGEPHPPPVSKTRIMREAAPLWESTAIPKLPSRKGPRLRRADPLVNAEMTGTGGRASTAKNCVKSSSATRTKTVSSSSTA
jgi:hypothetical protein